MRLLSSVPYDFGHVIRIRRIAKYMYKSYIYIHHTLTSSFVFILVIHHNRYAKAKDTRRGLVGSVSSDVKLDEEQKKKDEEEKDDDNEAAEYDTQHLIGGLTTSSADDSDRGGTVAFAKGMNAAAAG